MQKPRIVARWPGGLDSEESALLVSARLGREIILDEPRRKEMARLLTSGGHLGAAWQELVDRAEWALEADEIGGCSRDPRTRLYTGAGQVVCGPEGEPLDPYSLPERGERACAVHATFRAPSLAVVAGAVWAWPEVVCSSTVYSISISGTLPTMRLAAAPECQAAEAALRAKLACYHCRESHYRQQPIMAATAPRSKG